MRTHPYQKLLDRKRTWTPVQAEDMKFKIHRADFSPTTGTITLVNDNIGETFTAEDGTTTVYGRRLQGNPLTLTNSSTAMRVKHFDHGMYSTSNNVKITGAKSGIETTLNGAITATATITAAIPPAAAGLRPSKPTPPAALGSMQRRAMMPSISVGAWQA